MAADASISFDISLELGKIKTAIDNTSRKVKADFEKAFSKSAQKCQRSCDEMAGAFRKVDASADETRQKIEAILRNSEKSAKSKASSVAWIYRKQGMSQSEAMKKAWSEIERNSKSSSEKVKKSVRGIGSQAKETSGELTGALGPALKKIGFALGAAFSVKKLIDFGADCLRLGSDLQEVQNVVDVTFSQMSKQVIISPRMQRLPSACLKPWRRSLPVHPEPWQNHSDSVNMRLMRWLQPSPDWQGM